MGRSSFLDEAELIGRPVRGEEARVVSSCLTTSWTRTLEAEGMTGLMVDLGVDGEGCREAIFSRTGVSLNEVLSRSSLKREVGGEVREENRLDVGERAEP